MALVHIHHLDPDHESMLREILDRESSMIVSEISDDVEIEPDHLYVIPPGKVVRVEDGRLRISERDRSTIPMPIDLFLQSLAEDQRHRAIAVILSGSGSDGALGVKAIKEHDGFTIAQDESAIHRSMPNAAISTGLVDMVLNPSAIAAELVHLSKDPYLRRATLESTAPGAGDQRAFARIFETIRNETGIDFAEYKSTTINRRVRRRMAVHRIEKVSDYADLLKDNAEECEQLREDMLIRVTGFFRDPDVFSFLRNQVLPGLLEERSVEDPLRVWVPACATGEEVYSLAIVIAEALKASGQIVPFQIFGTDISERSIEMARDGIYPKNIMQQVPEPLLERYFSSRDGSYVISRALRDVCIFAKQDLTRDPPFSKLDLVSCRNVLIYLESSLQRRVFSVLEYALKSGGILVLGSSETTGAASESFTPLHRQFRIYEKKTEDRRFPLDLGTWERNPLPATRARRPTMFRENQSVIEQADEIILHQVAPPGVVINENFDVIQFRGRTSRYLEPPPGSPSFNIMKMARQGLLAELRTGVERAKRSGEGVRRQNVRVRLDDDYILVDLEIIPLATAEKERHYLLLFEERAAIALPAQEEESEEDGRSVSRLKRELESTREYLQSIIEEQEAMNEELRSANEEIQSNNEELQSMNEELETAKEELQSSNEELTTLNDELEMRNHELNTLNDDLSNILTSIEIPVIILGRDLRIRRFNPSAQERLNLIPADVGRPLSDLRASLEIERLEETVLSVIETLSLREIPLEGPRRGEAVSPGTPLQNDRQPDRRSGDRSVEE